MNYEKKKDRKISGVGISNGRAAGKLKFFRRDTPSPISSKRNASYDKKSEWERLRNALKKTADSISALYERALQTVGESEAQIFEIHGMLLEDEDFLDALRAENETGCCAEDAVDRAAKKISAMFEGLGDPYLSARATDMRDVAGQVLRSLSDEDSPAAQAEELPFILVADDLTPSETVMLEKSLILGFVTFRGTPNSHTAILARAMGIPALVSVGELDNAYDGTYALLDAADGTLTINPTEEQKSVFLEKQRGDDRIAQEHDRYLRGLMNKPAVTRSGHRMLIYANIGDGNEVSAALSNGADGIGLLRSEFLYLGADALIAISPFVWKENERSSVLLTSVPIKRSPTLVFPRKKIPLSASVPSASVWHARIFSKHSCAPSFALRHSEDSPSCFP